MKREGPEAIRLALGTEDAGLGVAVDELDACVAAAEPTLARRSASTVQTGRVRRGTTAAGSFLHDGATAGNGCENRFELVAAWFDEPIQAVGRNSYCP